jgi:glycine/D-amino acid oxidase-like deaminating enzyme
VADLVVLGAGIAGSAAAFQAIRSGASVTVVDAGLPGRATTAGAGIVSPVGLDRGESRGPWVDLVAECVRDYRRLTEEIDATVAGTGERTAPTFAVHGELVIAGDDAERAELRELEAWIAAVPRVDGRPVATAQRVDGPGVVERFGWLRPDLDALFVPEVGRVDGNRFAAALLAAAHRRAPRRITFRSGWADLHVGDARATVTVDGEAVDGDAVLVATGAWADGWRDRLGLRLAIHADAGEIIHLRPVDGATAGLPVVNTFGGSYLVPFDDRVVVGATHERRADYGADVTAAGQRAVLDRALGAAPGLASASVLETRVGLRPASADGLPMVGPTAVDGVTLVSGLGSWGLTLGPTLGAVAARAALGEPTQPRFAFLSPLRSPIPRDDAT